MVKPHVASCVANVWQHKVRSGSVAKNGSIRLGKLYGSNCSGIRSVAKSYVIIWSGVWQMAWKYRLSKDKEIWSSYDDYDL